MIINEFMVSKIKKLPKVNSMKKLIMLMFITFSFLVVALTNFAATETEPADSVFQNIDSNKDGKVEHDEFVQEMNESAFSKIDDDGDNIITWTEWNSIDNVKDRKKHEELFKFIDKNKDKRISSMEFSDYSEEYSNIEDSFLVLDSNKNGSLSAGEILNRPVFRLVTIRF